MAESTQCHENRGTPGYQGHGDDHHHHNNNKIIRAILYFVGKQR